MDSTNFLYYVYFLRSDATNDVDNQERMAVGAGSGRTHEEAGQGRGGDSEGAVHAHNKSHKYIC